MPAVQLRDARAGNGKEAVMTPLDTGTMKIWRDRDGRLWTLADAGIDTEIFELVGVPVRDEDSGLWFQQIQPRLNARDED